MTSFDDFHVPASSNSKRKTRIPTELGVGLHSRYGKFGNEIITLTLLRLEPVFINMRNYIIIY
jgi:hypothetical protein